MTCLRNVNGGPFLNLTELTLPAQCLGHSSSYLQTRESLGSGAVSEEGV